MVSSKLTHGWALSHHKFICGLNHDGSSNVPALSHSRSGVATTSLTMAEPHLAQNLRNTAIRRLPFGRTTKIRKGRTRLFLAVVAVAHCGQYGFCLALVADATAQATSDDIWHALSTPSRFAW